MRLIFFFLSLSLSLPRKNSFHPISWFHRKANGMLNWVLCWLTRITRHWAHQLLNRWVNWRLWRRAQVDGFICMCVWMLVRTRRSENMSKRRGSSPKLKRHQVKKWSASATSTTSAVSSPRDTSSVYSSESDFCDSSESQTNLAETEDSTDSCSITSKM